MDTATALKILDQLYAGVNPTTGQPFPAESPYNHPTIIRALGQIRVAVATPVPQAAREKTFETKRLQPGLANVGKRWTSEQDQQLRIMFQHGSSVEDVARQFER